MPGSDSIPVLDVRAFVRTHLHDSQLAERFEQVASRRFCVIQRIERFAAHVRFPVALNRTAYYAVLLLERGRMHRSDGFRTYELIPGSLYFDAPGSFFGIDSVSPDCSGHFALFDAEYLLSALNDTTVLDRMPFLQLGHRPDVALPPEAAAYVGTLLQQAQAYLERPAFPDQQVLAGTLLHLLLLTARQYSPPEPPPPPTAASALVQRFNALASAHFRTSHTVATYADQLAVSPRYLGRCVRQVTGEAPATLLMRLRLREAQVLLRGTLLPVAEVAYQLGFEDLSYFARLIRQHTGLSPTAYRRKA